MPDKVCSECGKKLGNNNRSGLCHLHYKREYQRQHKEQMAESNKTWYAAHREEQLLKAKQAYIPGSRSEERKNRYEANKVREIEQAKKWRAENNAKMKAYSKEWREQNKDRLVKKQADYYRKNKERILKQNSEWRKNNREKINTRQRERMKTDPQFKLSVVLRIRLNEALNSDQKSGSAVDDLGCSIQELKVYLETQFHPNPETGNSMTWENWTRNEGGWQIDHILPLSSFNLADPEQLKVACHYSNLRPMWHCDHLLKSIEERR